MKMHAAVLEEFGEPLAVQEVELAEPRAGEVLVRLHACGVCHTDLYTASGADPSGYSPTVLGHEGAGVVEAVGPDVGSLAPGDHVVTLFSPQCRECIHCLDERTNLCLAIRDHRPSHRRLLLRRRQGPRPGPGPDRPLLGRRDRPRPLRLPPARARRSQPRLRADGGPGRHPQRDRVRLEHARDIPTIRGCWRSSRKQARFSASALHIGS
jgi:hypothetical protein